MNDNRVVLIRGKKSRLMYPLPSPTHSHPADYASLLFHSPVAYRDPESCNMINLLIRLLIDALNEYAYNAEIAGIQYKVMNNIYGFMVMALWQIIVN